MRVLVVEDEPEVADFIARVIAAAGWASVAAGSVQDALQVQAHAPADLIVLDMGLPDGDGLTVCRTLRARGDRTPILALTARRGVQDRVAGLDAGADDYLAKPFAVSELTARLRALARRPADLLPVVLGEGPLELDPSARTVRRGARDLSLSSREFALLELLLRSRRRVLSRDQILERLWESGSTPNANAVEVLVMRVRRKLDAEGEAPLLHTVRGAGYMLRATDGPHGA